MKNAIDAHISIEYSCVSIKLKVTCEQESSWAKRLAISIGLDILYGVWYHAYHEN